MFAAFWIGVISSSSDLNEFSRDLKSIEESLFEGSLEAGWILLLLIPIYLNLTLLAFGITEESCKGNG